MDIQLYLALFLLLLPSLLTAIDFIKFLITGKHLLNTLLFNILGIIVVVGLPLFYLAVLEPSTNDCCSDSAAFSPEHRLTLYCLIFLMIGAYLWMQFKTGISSPVLEVAGNSILLGSIVFNIFVALQIDPYYSLFGNLPIALMLIMRLISSQKQLIQYLTEMPKIPTGRMETLAWKILDLHPLVKLPVFFLFCIPILFIVISLLLIAGQKPDSIIRVFTDTYKHRFSQLDYMCENVECGGHFLCSVAANGHGDVVKQIRLGERNGKPIVCNRQLLVSNAFEELLHEKFPHMHRIIRKNYNHVGNFIHRYYGIFNNKLVADLIYLLMKPAEWIFLFVLYSADRNPENRIASQYIAPSMRMAIKNKMADNTITE